jgi:hypothetical protein
VSPCSHWDDALNAKPNGEELILDCLRRGDRRDAFDDNPVGLNSRSDHLENAIYLLLFYCNYPATAVVCRAIASDVQLLILRSLPSNVTVRDNIKVLHLIDGAAKCSVCKG